METWQVILISIGITVFFAICTAIYKLAEWKGKVDEGRSAVADFMKEIRSDVKDILSRLPRSALQEGSPIRLTEFGEHLASQIKAKEWADRLCASGELQRRVMGMSNYEIQEFCLEFATSERQYDDDEIDLLRQCAYDNGVKITVVERVLGIVLRDRLLPPGATR